MAGDIKGFDWTDNGLLVSTREDEEDHLCLIEHLVCMCVCVLVCLKHWKGIIHWKCGEACLLMCVQE